MRISALVVSLLTAVTLSFSACGPRIYLVDDFRTYSSRHKTVAILPADVSIQLRPNQARATSAEQQRDLEQQGGLDFQDKIYSWLLRRSQQRGYTVQFQDVRQTNARLRELNIPYTELRTRTPQELAQLLGVDAVLSTSVRTTKPMSQGAAVALEAASALLGGFYGNSTTNQANVSVSINEGAAGKLLWKYDYVASGSLFSSSESVVDALMRNASKKFPYTRKS